MFQYPTISGNGEQSGLLTTFAGYNHKFGCEEGEFYAMENMASVHFPILSPRIRRGINTTYTKPNGMISKDALIVVDGTDLYVNGTKKSLGNIELEDSPKTLVGMGALLVIMPDKVWFNLNDDTYGKMEESFYNGVSAPDEVTVTLADALGRAITWHDEAYYTTHAPQSNDYCMAKQNGKSVLKQWSSSASVWTVVATTYVQFTCVGIGGHFKAGDGVKFTIDTSDTAWEDGLNIFVNDEGNGRHSVTTVIKDVTPNAITIAGLISENKTFSVSGNTPLPIAVVREVPDMAYITECNNRLWGCSADGHEIYACKLGDVTNWRVYAGISTDSWSVTIGSDGVFTGAITYQGYPIFFKEDSMIKVSVSATGAHQTKETYCRGVQNGCGKSLQILNEVLYYKAPTGVCYYSGSVPYSISEAFADDKYTSAVGGAIGEQYFVSMRDAKGEYHLFVYDTRLGLWMREDNTQALCFAKYDGDLFFIDANDKTLKSVGGSLLTDGHAEEDFWWYAESGTIGYSSPNAQYISRMTIKLNMDFGSRVSFEIQYDDGAWTKIFDMQGKGTRAFAMPIIPRRCDHFRWRLKGKGMVKVLSMTKVLSEGSDI